MKRVMLGVLGALSCAAAGGIVGAVVGDAGC